MEERLPETSISWREEMLTYGVRELWLEAPWPSPETGAEGRRMNGQRWTMQTKEEDSTAPCIQRLKTRAESSFCLFVLLCSQLLFAHPFSPITPSRHPRNYIYVLNHFRNTVYVLGLISIPLCLMNVPPYHLNYSLTLKLFIKWPFHPQISIHTPLISKHTP